MCNQCLSLLKLWVRIPFMARCTRYSIMWSRLSVTCDRSVVFCYRHYIGIFCLKQLKISYQNSYSYLFFKQIWIGDKKYKLLLFSLLLLRSMKKNPEVGATCGRIKPRGSGNVLVLYFIFVYSNVYISRIFRAFWICTGICDFIIMFCRFL
jgi:hypothetical protein